MPGKSPKETVDDLKTLVTGYAKQETVDPLKKLGSWVGFGLAGAMCMAVGSFLVGLGALRLLQSMSWTDGHLSWAPYLIIFIALFVLIGLCVRAMTIRPDWLDQEAS